MLNDSLLYAAAIEDFVREKSSVSMIHYYPQEDVNACVCEEHKDTGLLTAVFKTGVPSLQMWDKASDKYVKIEELAADSELILFMGEKIPLFAQQDKSLPDSSRFMATPHRVIVPQATVNRLSMAFLLDVAK
jgi:isopenicillin N synthase-like dioxygenase